jgi:peptidoglycan/LPS O-acetylase OafA/YrhL
MNGQPAQLPPPSNPALLPVLAAVTYLAALVATWGILSLALDQDVIGYSDAGPLLGPAMAVVAGVATWAWVVRTLRVSWVVRGALLAGVVSYSAVVITGAIGYGLERASIAWMPLAAAHFALSPFVVAAAPLTALTVIVAWSLARSSENRDG